MAFPAIQCCSDTDPDCKYWQQPASVFTRKEPVMSPRLADRIRESRKILENAVNTARDCRRTEDTGSIGS